LLNREYPLSIRHLLRRPTSHLLVFTHHFSRDFPFLIVSLHICSYKYISFHTRHLFTEITLPSNTSSQRVRYSVLIVLYYLRDPVHLPEANNYLWRWVVMIIVSLIIFVPLISSVNKVEILRLLRPVFVMPPINLFQHLLVSHKFKWQGARKKITSFLFLIKIPKYTSENVHSTSAHVWLIYFYIPIIRTIEMLG